MKQLIKKLYSYVPTRLPVGLSEFEQWCDDVLALSGLPILRDSAHQALANMIIHASPLKGTDTPRDRISKNHFVKGLRKGAANQVASYVFYEIQKEQEVKRAALKNAADPIGADLKQQVNEVTNGEATALSKAVGDEKSGV